MRLLDFIRPNKDAKDILASIDVESLGKRMSFILRMVAKMSAAAMDPDDPASTWNYGGMIQDIHGSSDREWQQYTGRDARKALNMICYLLGDS